ncbi:carboxysome shell carbonic anhydrase [Serpentinimonas raichei]|uniref:carboxysome shell carbonic anhydrase n=1 Tax=Serpentinimonas raichei TaxID=1458425 RepID=UPI00069357C2|nr:carboxysome shell carbonic anhydrase [Serpentinimonas raichei]
MNTLKRRQAQATPVRAGLAAAPDARVVEAAVAPRSPALALQRAARYRAAAAQKATAKSPARAAPATRAVQAAPAARTHSTPQPGHALVDADLNDCLHTYEQRVRGRFAAVLDVLRTLSSCQHERDFAAQAQTLALQKLGFELPTDWLANAWVAGVDMAALHAHCLFQTVAQSVQQAGFDQSCWRARMPIGPQQWRDWGYHTLDFSPCADGRLQALLPFILRTTPAPHVWVKAYAGALFDVEHDVADWTQRELERLTGAIEGGAQLDYLKVAVYHYSSSAPCEQGCAAHGSLDEQAVQAAIERLVALQMAVDNTFGLGAAPQVLLIGVDTDCDAIRIHLPDASGQIHRTRFLDSATLYRSSFGMPAAAAQQAVQQALQRHVTELGGLAAKGNEAGLLALVQAWLIANFSQIEYVNRHHAGRYAVIGHDEAFVCAGEAVPLLHLRNQFYFAHLDTVEEGAADLDVGARIFQGLNVQRGLALPVLVHFTYNARVPGARERAVQRGLRVAQAIRARFSDLAERGLLHCRVAVSERQAGSVLEWAEHAVSAAAH